MAHQLAALVVSEGLAHLQRYPIQRGTEALNGRCGGGTIHLGQEHQATDTLHQSANGRAIEGALDQVAFPMPRQQSLFDFRRSQVDADKVRDLLATITPASTGTDLVSIHLRPPEVEERLLP